MKRAAAALGAWICLASATPALAHEIRPAYLELREVAPDTFEVLFKTPRRGDLRLSLRAVFSGRNETTPVVSRRTADALVETWHMRALDPLQGQQVRIDGLENTMTDALVRIVYSDGESFVQLLTPSTPFLTIPADPGIASVASSYLGLGMGHILAGIDHLLFVLALTLIASNGRELVKAVTAFTAAHSVTLAAATLGFVHVPPPPVEALIALSIVFVALEIVRAGEGIRGLTARKPWVVAFAFGLLHGLGFAGALSEVGLPARHIPLALLFFNVGVEVGQLAFIAVVLGVAALLVRAGAQRLPPWTRLLTPYAIGSVATFWVLSRVSAFWSGG